MDGKDLRRIASASSTTAPVYFMDKDGGIHEVFSFKYVRNKDTGPVNLLMEIGTLVKEFGELRIEQPPQELIDYMNEKWNKEETK